MLQNPYYLMKVNSSTHQTHKKGNSKTKTGGNLTPSDYHTELFYQSFLRTFSSTTSSDLGSTRQLPPTSIDS